MQNCSIFHFIKNKAEADIALVSTLFLYFLNLTSQKSIDFPYISMPLFPHSRHPIQQMIR